MNFAASTSSFDDRIDRHTRALETFAARLRAHSTLGAEAEALVTGLAVHPAELRAHADLARFGTSIDHACLVVDGIVARFIQSKDGTRQTISTYLPGELADFETVVLPRADSGLQALGEASVLRIPLRDLRAAVARSPALTEALWREYALEASPAARASPAGRHAPSDRGRSARRR